MSNPRYGWWPYAKAMIKAYPQLHKEYEALHSQKITASISGMPGGGNASRSTENVALRVLPGIKQREHDAVAKAIGMMKRKPYGEDALKIVDLVFWKKKCNVTGAAVQVGCSDTTAFRYHREFINTVGKCFFEDFEKMAN